mgnify:CR=1 FL=1
MAYCLANSRQNDNFDVIIRPLSLHYRWDVEVIASKANIKVPPTFINKGEVVKHLISRYHDPGKEPSADDKNPDR